MGRTAWALAVAMAWWIPASVPAMAQGGPVAAIPGAGEPSPASAPSPAAVTAQPAATPEEVKDKVQALEAKAAPDGDKSEPAPEEKITPAEAKVVDPDGKEPMEDALTCLARTIYWEAKGESRPAMEAIANVVMNRVGRPGFPNTVCGVVKEGLSQRACQFSWWCDGRPDDVEEEQPYAIAKEIAAQALNQQLADRTDGATQFHNRAVSPAWAGDYVKTTELGGHLFYRTKDGQTR